MIDVTDYLQEYKEIILLLASMDKHGITLITPSTLEMLSHFLHSVVQYFNEVS